MKDRERGVVWEESIIFLPPAVKMVFLSATMSNTTEFAEWICAVHQKPCHVVYTDRRPVPLQHYAFPVGGAGLYLVVDEKVRPNLRINISNAMYHNNVLSIDERS